MLREFRIFPGHFPGHPGCFFGFFTHPWDMYCILTCGWPMLFQIFSHQIMCVHPADALKIPDFPGTFTPRWGCFFWVLVHPEDAPEIPHFPGTFTQTQGFFLSGFLDTTSCRCSGFSWDIYPDTGVVLFRFSGHYIMQILWVFSGHLPGHWGLFFFRFLYILQMLWKFRIFLGHLPRHRGCYFRVFRTLHHADAPIFLETFTWTWGFFFPGFPHTTSCRCSDFSQDIYTDTGVVFFGFSTQLKHLISLFPGLPLTHTKIYQDSAHL